MEAVEAIKPANKGAYSVGRDETMAHETVLNPGADKKILIPLTSSLYVPGRLKDTDNVIVDVGTGYFVEKVSLPLSPLLLLLLLPC